jgi:hypothetical protein
VAIDASQARLQSRYHALLRGLSHLMNVHGTFIVAAEALAWCVVALPTPKLRAEPTYDGVITAGIYDW